MSDMRHLLEKMSQFAGERVGQKPGDQVRGSEPMPRKGGGKKHPFQGRLVGGAAESTESILKDLDRVINENPVKRDLYQEWAEFNKDDVKDNVKSTADKIVAAGSAARDALSGIADAIPRPFDEKTYQDAVVKKPIPKTDWRVTDTKKIQEGTARVQALRDPEDPDNYHSIRFRREMPDGRIIDIEPYSGSHDNYYRQVTGKEPGQSPTSQAMQDVLIKSMQNPQASGPVIPEPAQASPQDKIIPTKTPNVPDDEDDVVAEWGAAGTAVGPGNDDADPVEIAAQRSQQVAGKQEQHNQLMGLVGQVNSARAQLADLNKQFPQGANPVEKAMSMQQQQAQRVQLGRQIEDLMVQVAALRSQA